MEVSQSISNSIHLLQRINKLFKSSELSDIKLIFSSEEGGPKTEFHLHKLILCSGSEVFRAMFGNEAWRESKTSEVVLQEEAFLHSSLESFLSYFYSGQITLTYSTLLNVLILADKYQVIDLQEVCIDFMLRHMALPESKKLLSSPHHPTASDSTTSQKSTFHPSTTNITPSETTLGVNTDSPSKTSQPPIHNLACSWLQYSQLTNHQNLTNMCSTFILNNFNKVIKSADFFNLDVDWLMYFLSHSSLVIPDEFILLQALVRWFMKDFDCPTPEHHFDHSLSENKNSKSNSDLPPSPSTSYFFSSPTSTISQPPTSLFISSSSSSASSYSINHSPSEFCGGKVKRSKSNDNFDINDDLGGNDLNENFQKNKIRKEDNDLNLKNDAEISEKADEADKSVFEDDGCRRKEDDEEENNSATIEKLLNSIRFPLMTTTQQKAIQTEVYQYLKKQTQTFLPASSSSQPPPKITNNQTLFSSPKSILSSFKSLTSSPLQFISSKMLNNKPICTAPPITLHRPSYAIFDTNPIFHYTSQSRKKFEVLLNSILERIDRSLHLTQALKSPDPHLEDMHSLICSHGFSKESLQLRNYTNDIWSTSLHIDKFRSLAKYEMRSVVFSSPSHPLFPEESALHPAWDWSVELFAKGVIYHKCLMIGLWRNLEVMGDSYDMVRLAIHSEKHKSNHPTSNHLSTHNALEVRRVVVSVLITGYQNDAEFIVDCIEQTFTFDSDLETKFINNLFPFSCLNNCKPANNNNNESLYDSLDDLHGFTLINEHQSNENNNDTNNTPTTIHTHVSKENKDYFSCSSLLGSTDTLKTTIIIKPLLAI